jgi:hypothetical protein
MRIKTALAAHPVLAFAILAYAISWSFSLPLLAARHGLVSWSGSTYLHLWGGLGPAAAALIVTGITEGTLDVVAFGFTDPGTWSVAFKGVGSIVSHAYASDRKNTPSWMPRTFGAVAATALLDPAAHGMKPGRSSVLAPCAWPSPTRPDPGGLPRLRQWVVHARLSRALGLCPTRR